MNDINEHSFQSMCLSLRHQHAHMIWDGGATGQSGR